MNVLVIDNIDSFVYIIVQYVGMLGAEPVVVQNNVNLGDIENIVKDKEIEHVIISPGPRTPEDAGVTLDVIRRFCTENKKILGVCLGHLCMGYVFGAAIRNAKEIRHGKVSLVKHNGENVLKGLKNPLSAVMYHSQVLDEGDNGEALPDSLEVTARSLDDNEIMAIRHRDYDIFGVQFHPESILTEDGLGLIKNFIDM